MCIWMSPYHVIAILTKQAFGSCLEIRILGTFQGTITNNRVVIILRLQNHPR